MYLKIQEEIIDAKFKGKIDPEFGEKLLKDISDYSFQRDLDIIGVTAEQVAYAKNQYQDNLDEEDMEL